MRGRGHKFMSLVGHSGMNDIHSGFREKICTGYLRKYIAAGGSGSPWGWAGGPYPSSGGSSPLASEKRMQAASLGYVITKHAALARCRDNVGLLRLPGSFAPAIGTTSVLLVEPGDLSPRIDFPGWHRPGPISRRSLGGSGLVEEFPEEISDASGIAGCDRVIQQNLAHASR